MIDHEKLRLLRYDLRDDQTVFVIPSLTIINPELDTLIELHDCLSKISTQLAEIIRDSI